MTLTRVFDSGIQVALCNGDKGVALVILEVDVKVRMVLTNQIALEHQRLVLGLHHDIVKARHQLHHQRDLLALVLQRHVLTHTGAQVFRLAHVDDIALGVFPKVAAGLRGNARNLLGKRWNVVVTGHAHLLATNQRRDLGHLKDDGKAKGNSKRDDTRNANVAKSNQNRAAKCPDKLLKRPHDAGACGSTQATEQKAKEPAMQDRFDLKTTQATTQPPQRATDQDHVVDDIRKRDCRHTEAQHNAKQQNRARLADGGIQTIAAIGFMSSKAEKLFCISTTTP